MKALVIGGAGFIGSHLAERLTREGHHVRVFDNLSTGKRDNLAAIGDDVELVVADVRHTERLRQEMRGCEVVFHQAAIVSVPYSIEHPDETLDVNLRGTLNVLEAAKSAGVRRVVMASSAAVYGEDPELPKRETMLPAPISARGPITTPGSTVTPLPSFAVGWIVAAGETPEVSNMEVGRSAWG